MKSINRSFITIIVFNKLSLVEEFISHELILNLIIPLSTKF